MHYLTYDAPEWDPHLNLTFQSRRRSFCDGTIDGDNSTSKRLLFSCALEHLLPLMIPCDAFTMRHQSVSIVPNLHPNAPRVCSGSRRSALPEQCWCRPSAIEREHCERKICWLVKGSLLIISSALQRADSLDRKERYMYSGGCIFVDHATSLIHSHS